MITGLSLRRLPLQLNGADVTIAPPNPLPRPDGSVPLNGRAETSFGTQRGGRA